MAGLDAAWPVADVLKQQNIEYGAAYNNYTRQEQRLTLDLYSPPASDPKILKVTKPDPLSGRSTWA